MIRMSFIFIALLLSCSNTSEKKAAADTRITQEKSCKIIFNRIIENHGRLKICWSTDSLFLSTRSLNDMESYGRCRAEGIIPVEELKGILTFNKGEMSHHSILTLDTTTILFSLYDDLYRGRLFVAKKIKSEWKFLTEGSYPYIPNKEGRFIIDINKEKIITLGHNDFQVNDESNEHSITPLLIGKIGADMILHEQVITMKGIVDRYADSVYMQIYTDYNDVW